MLANYKWFHVTLIEDKDSNTLQKKDSLEKKIKQLK